MPTADPEAIDRRRRRMGVTARARRAELEPVADFPAAAAAADLRRPEIGLVMLRGRTGGDGAPFNLGEATVTRASVRLPGGAEGHAYVLGRDIAAARLAALVDALAEAGEADRVEAEIVAPIAARLAREDSDRAAETEATRVRFFTMVRGEG